MAAKQCMRENNILKKMEGVFAERERWDMEGRMWQNQIVKRNPKRITKYLWSTSILPFVYVLWIIKKFYLDSFFSPTNLSFSLLFQFAFLYSLYIHHNTSLHFVHPSPVTLFLFLYVLFFSSLIYCAISFMEVTSCSSKPHVLAVDDNLVDRKLVEMLLKKSSCKGSFSNPFCFRLVMIKRAKV